jgi:hypothetical protein
MVGWSPASGLYGGSCSSDLALEAAAGTALKNFNLF